MFKKIKKRIKKLADKAGTFLTKANNFFYKSTPAYVVEWEFNDNWRRKSKKNVNKVAISTRLLIIQKKVFRM